MIYRINLRAGFCHKDATGYPNSRLEGQHSNFHGSDTEITDDAEIVEALVFRRLSS